MQREMATMGAVTFSPKQIQAIKNAFDPDVRELYLVGAVRSSKTFTTNLIWLLWTQGVFKEPQEFIIGGKSYRTIVRNVLREMEKFAASLGMSWKHHHADGFIQCGKHVYHLLGGEDADSEDAVRGMTAAGALLDEMLTLHPAFTSMVTTRLSVAGAMLLGTMNPGNPGHYVKTDYIDQVDNKFSKTMTFIMDDNPSLDPVYVEHMRKTLKGADYDRLFLGLWAAQSGLVFPNVPFVGDIPAVYSAGSTYHVSVDYSTSGTVAMLLIRKSNDGTSCVIDEWYHTATSLNDTDNMTTSNQLSDNEIVEQLTKWLKSNGYDPQSIPIIPDPSAASFKRSLFGAGYSVLHADNDILDGVRVTNMAINRGLVSVSKTCVNLRREIESYVWDAKAQERGEDKPQKLSNHHGVDAFRYYVNKTYRYLNSRGPVSKPKGF